MARSDWQTFATQALREGRSLQEASRAYRLANAHTNPSLEGRSPEMARRGERNRRIGELLRAGHPFHEAARVVDRGFDTYQRGGRRLERSITHPFSRHNPEAGRNWLLMGGLAVGLYLLWQRGAGAPATGGQAPTLLPNPAYFGPGSGPVVLVAAPPGGF